jgi:hypothetical protein
MSEPFAGYDLETGLLQRVRRWRDALPVLVLLDALRVAGSPLYVGLALLAALLSGGVVSSSELLGESRIVPQRFIPLDGGIAIDQISRSWVSSTPFAPLVAARAWVSDFRWLATVSLVEMLRMLLVIAIWALPAATIARAGACYAAGREQSISKNVAVAFKRLPWLGAIVVLPLAVVLCISVAMVAVGFVARAGRAGMWISEVLAVLALPIVISIGLLTAGALVAIPLAWAAMVVEKRCDTFDSLSRGYEYLYRRPIALLFYGLCGYALVMIAFGIAWAVSSAGSVAAVLAVHLGGGSSRVPTGFQTVLSQLPLAVGGAAFWGQVGAIYLLMRQSANQQEIEDLAISPVDRREAELPSLHTAG